MGNLAPRLPSQAPTPPSSAAWISRDHFLKLASRSTVWLLDQVKARTVRTRETGRKLKNGRMEVEFDAAGLPPKAFARFQAEQRALIPAQPTTLDLFAPVMSLVARRRVSISRAAQPEADYRLDFLQPIIAYREHAHPGYTAPIHLRLADGRPVNSLDRVISYQAEHSEAAFGKAVSARTIYRWLDRYDAGGAPELAKRKRSDADRSRWFREHKNAACLVASLYLGDGFFPGISVTACHSMLRVQRDLVGVNEADLPDRTTVGRFLQSAPEHLKILAKQGRKKYQESVLPYLRRGYTEASNSIWVSDHAIFDVEVQNDLFPDQPLGTPIRLRLTAILDYRSRYLVGYSFCWEGTSASIATALRRAVLAHGPAELFYVDNGRDFVKVAKGATPGYMKVSPLEPEGWVDAEIDRMDTQLGLLARLGMRVNHCIPHHPQSKHVERFFNTVHSQFCALWWTYTSGTPANRPDATTALMQIQRKANREGVPSRGLHPTASQFMSLFQVWLDQYHAEGDRRMEGTQGRSPAQVFAEERNPRQRPTPEPEELACLLSEHTFAKVDACAVRLNKRRYVPRDEASAILMQRLHGQRVRVGYDPLDPATVNILDGHMHLITILAEEQLVRFAPDDPETQAAVAESFRISGHIQKASRQDLQLVTRERKRLGGRTPLELLAENARPIDAEDIVTWRSPKLNKLSTRSAPRQTYTSEAVAAFFSEK